jgi:hypothetical protein
MTIYEKRVSDTRCYTTTTYYLFGRKVRQVKVYKGGKAPSAPKPPPAE